MGPALFDAEANISKKDTKNILKYRDTSLFITKKVHDWLASKTVNVRLENRVRCRWL
jgi:hypothetical protein